MSFCPQIYALFNPKCSFVAFQADCNQSRFPDPRDFRIAIVEGAPEVRLRIGFLSPALTGSRGEDVEVKLVLGVGCSGWPQSCDFPSRAPLGHVDCLLFLQAAQTVNSLYKTSVEGIKLNFVGTKSVSLIWIIKGRCLFKSAMKAYGGSRGTAPLIFNFDTTWWGSG